MPALLPRFVQVRMCCDLILLEPWVFTPISISNSISPELRLCRRPSKGFWNGLARLGATAHAVLRLSPPRRLEHASYGLGCSGDLLDLDADRLAGGAVGAQRDEVLAVTVVDRPKGLAIGLRHGK